MRENVKKMYDFLLERSFRERRSDKIIDITELVEGKSEYETQVIRLREMLKNEGTLIYEEDVFGFNRTIKNLPKYNCKDGKKSRTDSTGNITVNFKGAIEKGFDSIIDFCKEKLNTELAESSVNYYNTVIEMLTIVLDFCDRYRDYAKNTGNETLYNALLKVPHGKATCLYEACLFQKIILYMQRLLAHSHTTLGRFDQYMYDYYKMDKEKGLSDEELLEIIELYFISLNLDTDIYHGVQQGDNGQSMVLGGFDLEGNSMFNELSKLVMEASLELTLIDPKINLRVGKNTPDWLYEYATKLTKKGLGFPQYCNDDIVVPGLTKLGYKKEDAVNYTVAACWEYIIPNCSMDVPNIDTFNFPLVVNNALHAHLKEAESFEALMEFVDKEIRQEVNVIIERRKSDWHNRVHAAPLLSIFVDGCIEQGKDLSEFGAKYNCFGCHGAGIANGADALAAVKKLVYENKEITKEEILNALNSNFEGCEELRNKLLNCPKMGNNDDYVDELGSKIMESFSSEMNGRDNGYGGFWRAGTGSAMEYIWSARKCPATADGKKAGEAYGSSFSPAITTKLNGPLSVIQSFTKFDMTKIINGGPLTMEVHDTVFRNEEGEKKVAALVKAFVHLGGHQLQINSINRERLLDAQKHPENYPNLVVRVWGWSGYFCELDLEYQNHVIRRTEFSV